MVSNQFETGIEVRSSKTKLYILLSVIVLIAVSTAWYFIKINNPAYKLMQLKPNVVFRESVFKTVESFKNTATPINHSFIATGTLLTAENFNQFELVSDAHYIRSGSSTLSSYSFEYTLNPQDNYRDRVSNHLALPKVHIEFNIKNERAEENYTFLQLKKYADNTARLIQPFEWPVFVNQQSKVIEPWVRYESKYPRFQYSDLAPIRDFDEEVMSYFDKQLNKIIDSARVGTTTRVKIDNKDIIELKVTIPSEKVFLLLSALHAYAKNVIGASIYEEMEDLTEANLYFVGGVDEDTERNDVLKIYIDPETMNIVKLSTYQKYGDHELSFTEEIDYLENSRIEIPTDFKKEEDIFDWSPVEVAFKDFTLYGVENINMDQFCNLDHVIDLTTYAKENGFPDVLCRTNGPYFMIAAQSENEFVCRDSHGYFRNEKGKFPESYNNLQHAVCSGE